MNASYSSESMVPAAAADWSHGSRQAPSVPISVYRELATELKATQALVDSLTQQNQQLGQQNLFLRQEMMKFAESAAQLKQVVDGRPVVTGDTASGKTYPLQPIAIEPPPTPAFESPSGVERPDPQGSSPGFALGGVSQLTSQVTQMLGAKAPAARGPNKAMKPKAKRPQPVPPPRMLYTEERLEPSRPGQSQGRNADVSGLWLAATILLIVVSAFGAGFLIMRPLLNTSR
ncbi:hypothetical protein GFS31_30430 [Leptolyngbya sp. BL0902]|uniref:hypothetical protein n=1 Tax=Leptolyngbya sp. BL0902 TaxID=1115757 RepID=UPI0018E834AE|nr:hypothetical protein [Leptolyngbya sp. BL0902]QQE66345.1 hypothetical protein GFS31_30430 [Leptolyngbya sp. BL0902]